MKPPREPLLSIQNLETRFETPDRVVRAVNNVSLDVGPGQALGIVGESGSGKSQTFFSVFGLSHGTPGVVAGSARFDGVDLLEGLSAHVTPTARSTNETQRIKKDVSRWNRVHHNRLKSVLGTKVALMSQDPKRSLVPYWTVGRHLDEVVGRNTTSSGTHSSEALLAQLGFRDARRVLDAFPEELSGGEAQRVMLALTLAISPKLLVADEPTTALDAVNQVRVLSEIRRLHTETGIALVLVSHDLAVVTGLVTDVLVFFGGYVVERASVEVLRGEEEGPLHPYTLDLMLSQRRRAAGQPIPPSRESLDMRAKSVGCPFASRCALRPRSSLTKQTMCETEFPPEVQVSDTHSVACWGIAE